MAFDLSCVTSGARRQPLRTLIYGPHGVGKTYWSAGWPSPIFIPTEDGMGLLETPAFPLCEEPNDVLTCLHSLFNEDHAFKTVVIDSADWLDNAIINEVRARHTIQELAYGKEAGLFNGQWKLVLDWLAALRNVKRMHAVLIAHCEVKPFNPPDGESYERYLPKMAKGSSALLQEWADIVLFANFRHLVVTEENRDKRKESVRRAVTTGERLLHTGEKPAYVAKNRYSMPETIEMSWEAFQNAIPYDLTV